MEGKILQRTRVYDILKHARKNDILPQLKSVTR